MADVQLVAGKLTGKMTVPVALGQLLSDDRGNTITFIPIFETVSDVDIAFKNSGEWTVTTPQICFTAPFKIEVELAGVMVDGKWYVTRLERTFTLFATDVLQLRSLDFPLTPAALSSEFRVDGDNTESVRRRAR